MNCSEIANILDELEIHSLTRGERRAALAHVSTCASCAEQWHASLDLGKLRSSAPVMSDSFRATLKSLSSASAGSARENRRRRPFLVVGALLACAASAAALLSVEFGSSPDLPVQLIDSARDSAFDVDRSVSSASLSPARDVSDPLRDAGATAGRKQVVTVAVLPLVHLNDDPASIAESSRYFEEFLEPLDAHSEVIRIADSELAEFGNPELSLEHIGESISADFYVRIANEKPHGVGLVGNFPLDNWPEANRALSIELAMPVRGRFGFGTRVSRINASSERWDTTIETKEVIDSAVYSAFQQIYYRIRPELRVPGFSEPIFPTGFGPGRLPGGMTERDVLTLIEQGRLADDPAQRSNIWVRLRRTEHAAVVVPALTESVLYDPVDGVRMAALDSLMGYLETPGARETLQAISIGEVPAALRERASMYLRSPSEHQAYTVERLLDESLTDEERLAPLLAISLADYGDGSSRSSEYIDDIQLPNTTAISAALIELAIRAVDTRTRTRLIERMYFAEGAEVVDQLLAFLSSDPDEEVREAAVESLAPRVDQERVRAALEVARQNDPSANVQAEARDALQRDAR